ncbi:hypothetical protein SAMN05421821_103461 [Mucilaginibacter lappiensis]|uniref:Beta-xylosidase n=1 Tax=Mucilaginibacter lappiensis TaxID=354630 RepID=A0ABR6PHJ7_9SPHI|nr:hypothetical protein [Mucilaginibacter lappiensis]MBB6109225.1 beta-xylosidase [Mucilaginibacter lappiensis]SIQ80805.1 hypothetical protein SAMN05421821_103461 [Mucilaginibacter lappiensis]
MNKIMNFMAVMPFIMLSFLAFAQTTRGKKGDSYFTNPIFKGDYPDPSILSDGRGIYEEGSDQYNYQRRG